MVKTIISAVTTWVKNYFKQPDWNEIDISSTAYIKNKPTVPNKLSQLTNDKSFITLTDVPSDDNKMDKTNPTGTGSFSLNRKSESIIGRYSVAQGNNVIANGLCSNVGGQYNNVQEYYPTVSANVDYKNGDIVFDSYDRKYYIKHSFNRDGSVSNRNTESYDSVPQLKYYFTHWEPILLNESSEEISTFQSGVNYKNGDIVLYKEKYYKLYTNYLSKSFSNSDISWYFDYWEEYDVTSVKTYLTMVGNGESDESRSNAHTLDWDGNAWFSGDVYVGSTSGTNKDEGSVKLAKVSDIPTDTYINSLIDSKISSLETIADSILEVM